MLHRAGRGRINPLLIEKIVSQSLWRNGIARWTSNPEAPGSSPGRDVNQWVVAFWRKGDGRQRCSFSDFAAEMRLTRLLCLQRDRKMVRWMDG